MSGFDPKVMFQVVSTTPGVGRERMGGFGVAKW
jgi:hypothetical protein